MFELVNKMTGVVIERHDYDFLEFIRSKYSRFCSLQTKDGLIVGDVRPEIVWQDVTGK